MAPGNLIDGRAIAEQIHADSIQRIARLKGMGYAALKRERGTGSGP